MMFIRRAPILAAFLLLLSTGCAIAQVETARQLDEGQRVNSVAFDVPGAMVIPKASLRTIYGLGNGDISAHIGTALLSASAGVGGRYYLGENFTLSLQTDATAALVNLFTSGPNHGVFLFTATPRISTAVSPDRTNGFYGGIQAHVTSVLEPVIEHVPAADEGILTDQYEFYSDGVVAGIFFGLDRLQPGRGKAFRSRG